MAINDPTLPFLLCCFPLSSLSFEGVYIMYTANTHHGFQFEVLKFEVQFEV